MSLSNNPEPTTSNNAPTAGRNTATTDSRGRNSAGGRNRHRGGRQSRGGQARGNRSTFKGNTEEMNGHVFECYEEQSDRRQYAKTLEALEGYVKKTLNLLRGSCPTVRRGHGGANAEHASRPW